MKAGEFLKISEQETIQVLPPFDVELIKQEFGKKAAEFEYSGITIEDVKFTPDGTTLVLKQGNASAEVTFSYSDDVGPFAAVKPASGESVNLDLTPMSPPVLDSSGLGKQIDLQSLVWLSKEGFEAICAASNIKETPEEEIIPGEPEQVGSDGSGAATPTSQQPQSPPIELDAKEVPAPRPQGQTNIPGESYREGVDDDVLMKCRTCGYTASNYEFLDADRGDVYPHCPECGSKEVEDAEVEEAKEKETKVKVSDLPPEVQNQIKVAKDTLKMNDPMAAVMGGMNKTEATMILQKYGVLKGESFNPKAMPGISEEKYRITFQKGADTGIMDVDAASEDEANRKAQAKLRTDQKIISVGKHKKQSGESKEITLFRFVIREGKRVKIPIGVFSIKEKELGNVTVRYSGEEIPFKDLPASEQKKIAFAKKVLAANIPDYQIRTKTQVWNNRKEIIDYLNQYGINVTEAKKDNLREKERRMACQKCGYKGDEEEFFSTMKSIVDKNHAVAACPSCGNKDRNKLDYIEEAKKDNTPAWKKKIGKHKEAPHQPGKKMKERHGYGSDDEPKNCPACKGVTGKADPNCKRCKGKGVVEMLMKRNITYHTIIREGREVRIPVKRPISLREQQVTKRFFITMANAIKSMPDPIGKAELVNEMVRIFQAENPRFDSGRFRMACGV